MSSELLYAHGTSLFDHVLAVANRPYCNGVVERFCSGNKVLVAGELCGRKDLELVSYVCNADVSRKCIIVPHTIYEEGLHKIIAGIDGKSLLYSECSTDTDFNDVQVLIIDFLGSLPKIYRFCHYAYIGGGFASRPDKIISQATSTRGHVGEDVAHSLRHIAEATVCGLPMAFGPKISRKPVAAELMALGVGKAVSSGKELNKWLRSLEQEEQALANIRSIVASYVKGHSKAPDNFMGIT